MEHILSTSPPDRPHLIMLFCFLISRNAKCLCHLWTAKRANLGFSLIATVTSLLRLHWGWVEGMAGGGLEDGRMEGWRHSSPHTRPRCERTRQANRTQPGGVQQQGVGDSLRCEKAPNTQLRGRRIQLWPVLVSQLWWGDDYTGLDNCWTYFWHWLLLLPPPDLILVPTRRTRFYCSFNRQILGITQQAVFKLEAWHVLSMWEMGVGGGDDRNKTNWNIGCLKMIFIVIN